MCVERIPEEISAKRRHELTHFYFSLPIGSGHTQVPVVASFEIQSLLCTSIEPPRSPRLERRLYIAYKDRGMASK